MARFGVEKARLVAAGGVGSAGAAPLGSSLNAKPWLDADVDSPSPRLSEFNTAGGFFGIMCGVEEHTWSRDMSIMIDLPPAMAQEAREYATVQGTTLERMLFDCIRAELARKRHQADHVVSEFDALVEKTSSRRDRPYQFNRSDAYAEVMA